MNLLKRVEEYKKVKKNIREIEQDLISSLKQNFVDLEYKMKRVEIKNGEQIEMELDLEPLFYPVLDVPKGYSKEEEQYTKYWIHSLNHEYILKNQQNTKIKVVEHSNYIDTIYSTRNDNRVILPCRIINQKIWYKITIDDEKFEFERHFDYKVMLEKIDNNEIGVAEYKLLPEMKSYERENQNYSRYIKQITNIEPGTVKSLKEIINSNCNQMKLGCNFIAKIETKQHIKQRDIRFENGCWSACINNIQYIQNSVWLEIYSIKGRSISKKAFLWYELIEKEYEKGLTFEEAVKLVKEE